VYVCDGVQVDSAQISCLHATRRTIQRSPTFIANAPTCLDSDQLQMVHYCCIMWTKYSMPFRTIRSHTELFHWSSCKWYPILRTD